MSASDRNGIPMDILYSNINNQVIDFPETKGNDMREGYFEMTSPSHFNNQCERNIANPRSIYGNLGINSGLRKNSDYSISRNFTYNLQSTNDLSERAFEKSCSSPNISSYLRTPTKNTSTSYYIPRNYTTPIGNFNTPTPFSSISNSFVSPTRHLESPIANSRNRYNHPNSVNQLKPQANFLFASPQNLSDNYKMKSMNSLSEIDPFNPVNENNAPFVNYNDSLQSLNNDFSLPSISNSDVFSPQKTNAYILNSNISPNGSCNNLNYENFNSFGNNHLNEFDESLIKKFSINPYIRPGITQYSSSQRKRYMCEVCKKLFARPSTLSTHMHSHTGEKPYHCDWEGCGKKFSVMSNLRRHQKIHSRQQGREDCDRSESSQKGSFVSSESTFDLDSKNSEYVYNKPPLSDQETEICNNGSFSIQNQHLFKEGSSEGYRQSAPKQHTNEYLSSNFLI
ncbi:Zinc finger protein [Smittium mucronatum]|uniref:Zinc finger protein n=1 Tax=Smittium mucronatum TaxID=133383 RepID=A0A1R0GMA0_9FUNG|nr:Zinc finger protein [Smittium mucronatum]